MTVVLNAAEVVEILVRHLVESGQVENGEHTVTTQIAVRTLSAELDHVSLSFEPVGPDTPPLEPPTSAPGDSP